MDHFTLTSIFKVKATNHLESQDSKLVLIR